MLDRRALEAALRVSDENDEIQETPSKDATGAEPPAEEAK
jgi:hypothetical protein